jgi:hypothetical protein
LNEGSFPVKTRLHVLSIGSAAISKLAYESFLQKQGHALKVVSEYRDLFHSEMSGGCEVAVLHQSLSHDELVEVAHFIRRRWPVAKILIVRPEEWWIDDALYDDRVVPGANPELLLSAVERLVGNSSEITPEYQLNVTAK